jgi:hypothetical protein
MSAIRNAKIMQAIGCLWRLDSLILIWKEINRPHANMTQCITLEAFDVIAKCAIIACGENYERELQHPSVAIKPKD